MDQTNPEPRKTNQAEPEPNINIDLADNVEGVDRNRASTSSSSTASALSDGDDFFQIDPVGLGMPVHTDGYNNPSTPSVQFSSLPPLSPMNRNGIPDPNRIPLSVFARTKSTAPTDWSVQSNESLFSIQMGNSSFSRDHVFLGGRSGELTNFQYSYQAPPISPLPYPLTAMPLPPISSVSSSTPEELDAQEETGEEASNNMLRADAKEEVRADTDKEEKSGMDDVLSSKSMSRKSDSSISSFQSFAFPILTSGDGRSGSVKVEPVIQQMKHQQQPQHQFDQSKSSKSENVNADTTTAEAPAAGAAEKGWFSCFSCCPFSLFPRT